PARGRDTTCYRDWSSDVCASDLAGAIALQPEEAGARAGGRPVAAGGGERLADVGVAGDARGGGVDDLVDDGALGRVLGDGLVVGGGEGVVEGGRVRRGAGGWGGG